MDTEHTGPLITPPAKDGRRAFITGTRIAVDDIISSYQIILDRQIVAELREWFPHLSEEQIREALEYYRDHPAEIEERLKQDREVRRTNERKKAGLTG